MWRSLLRSKGRAETGLFLVEGPRVVMELLDSPLHAEALLHPDPVPESARELVEAFLDADGRIAVMRIARRMLERRGVDPIDTQNMADIPRSQAAVLIGVLLMEMADNRNVKVSLRSAKGVDIEPVARRFEGGGHRQAAGCRIMGGIDDVERILVAELIKQLPLENAAP